MRKLNLIGSGIAPLAANNIMGIVTSGLTATGSDQAGALAITDDISIVTTTAASTGVRLPAGTQPGDTYVIANHGANSLSVYPPTGGKIANGTGDAAKALAATKAGIYISIDGTNYAAVISA
jgi:hypothetical protein